MGESTPATAKLFMMRATCRRELIVRNMAPGVEDYYSRVKSFRRPHRWLSALALAASLLLSLLPAAGRLQQAFAQEAQSDAALAMCTLRGLEYVPASRADVLSTDPRAPQGDPEPAGHGDDCAYCPLLASLDLPATPPTAHPAPLSSSDDFRSLSGRDVTAAHRMGLGPRGPPRMVSAG